MRSFVRERAFGILFTATPEGPRVAHVPVVWLDEERVGFHLARGNSLARHLDGMDGLLVVNGPDSYISPDWYGVPDQVPTWNYVSVEMHGEIRRLGQEELTKQIDLLSQEQEKRLAPKPVWSREKMSVGLFERMLESICGFEMTVAEIRGTLKLGQNKPASAREGAACELQALGHNEMAQLMLDLPE